ncbi:MAG: hypothetical protein GYA23_05670 [Methanomicrobiales archaeon]|nr:hypothetical protein [Methanomicrobiales archaeon]
MVRKQSIHAFLDLYQKGVISVEEQDIRKARQLLSDRCDAIKREQDRSPSGGEGTVRLQVRVCSDLVMFCDDLEKMYRLIQKQGIVASYLMILGTFATVLEENKNARLAGRYDLEPALIASLAAPLVDSIRLRLGTDRNWRSALRELAIIAARFNKRYPEPKFDQDMLLQVGPVVVSHFEKDVPEKEIFALIPDYADESELDEFESFLNKTPAILREEENAGIDWDAIYPPLKSVADAMAAQREQWAEERNQLCDHYSLIVPQTASAPAVPLPRPGGVRTFDIAVSGDAAPGEPAGGNVSGNAGPQIPPAIKGYLPILAGIGIILLFIAAGVYLSGDAAGMFNSTAKNATATGNITKVTTKPTVKPNTTTTVKPGTTTVKPGTTTAKPATTTAKPASTKTITPTPTPVAYSASQIGAHLLDIAFGPDNTKLQKPTKALIAISFLGAYADRDKNLLTQFIKDFNNYSNTLDISTNVNYNSPGDITLDFRSGEALSQINPDLVVFSIKDLDSGQYYFIKTNDKIYVNADLNGYLRDRWVLRAILYDLGFMGESAKYSDSLFYTDTTKGNKLTTIDLKAIQLMYGKSVTNGLTKSQTKAIVNP